MKRQRKVKKTRDAVAVIERAKEKREKKIQKKNNSLILVYLLAHSLQSFLYSFTLTHALTTTTTTTTTQHQLRRRRRQQLYDDDDLIRGVYIIVE